MAALFDSMVERPHASNVAIISERLSNRTQCRNDSNEPRNIFRTSSSGPSPRHATS